MNKSLPYMARPYTLVSLMAIIPFQEQFDEFDRVFGAAVQPNPYRDKPKYLSYIVQRAEVTGAADEPLQWQEVKVGDVSYGNAAVAQQLPAAHQWQGALREAADNRYLMPTSLTAPTPPLLLREYRHLIWHPDIPLQYRAAEAKVEDAKKTDDAADPMPDGLIPSAVPGRTPAAGMGAAGTSGAGVAGMGGDAAMGMGVEGDSMGAMSPTASMSSANQMTDVKLLRFFDITAAPGKKYRYRVQLLIEDPNHPKDPSLDVVDRYLDAEVVARLAALKAQEDTSKTRMFYRFTEWSDPSDIVEVPRTSQRILAGPTSGPVKTISTPYGEVALEESDAKAIAILWDPRYATDVVHEQSVRLGSSLSFQGPVDLVHPITMEFKRAPEYAFQSGAIVVDLQAGEQIGGDRSAPVTAPVQFAFVDADGVLDVRDELTDVELFELYKEPVGGPASAAPAGPAQPGMMDPCDPAGGLGAGLGAGLGGDSGGRRGRGRGN